ncbi:MAG: LrgB family protein [Cyanobacteriota bacterium]|nr:LrgB family protein [Cyanobacteriota bacterium]
MTLTLLGLALTVLAYALSRWINARYPSPLTVPVLLSTPMVMLAITLAGSGLEGYRGASDAITWWLGPATVSLGVPLYRHRQVLRDHGVRVAAAPVVAGIVVASALLGTILGLALLTRLGVRSPLGRGLALGTISSGQGVAQAFREGELTGAIASVAMALAAVAVALLALPLALCLGHS